MHRLQRFLAAALFVLVAHPAAAQFTRDNAATKKIDEAINNHYLATEFDKAEGVLTGTINACGDKCSPQVIGKAWMYVGIVRGSGKNDLAGAKEAFQKALASDPGVKLDSALATPETQKAFQDAGGSGSAAPPPPTTEPPPAAEPPAAGGEESGEGVTCTPEVREVQTRRPIPVQCTTDEEATAMELRYKVGDTWKSVRMDKKGESYRGEVPCDATMDPTTLRVYVRAKDASGEVVGSWGTKGKPIEFGLGEDVAAEPPKFDDAEAPLRCEAKEECPPDFPGCGPSGPKRGDKDWGASCDNSSECKEGLLCMSGTCETAPSCDTDADCDTGSCVGGTCDIGDDAGSSTAPFKRHWLGLHVAQDVTIIGGSDVCKPETQAAGDFVCFSQGEDRPYVGEPFPGTGIATGTVLATTRFLLSYDFALTPNITLGTRLGYAIGGGPPAEQELVEDGGIEGVFSDPSLGANDPDPAGSATYNDDTYGGGKDFLPFHAELRGTFWIGRNALAKKGLRPFIGIGGGLAQVDAKVPVTIKDCTGDTEYDVDSPMAAAGNPSSLTPEQDCEEALINFDQRQMPDVKLDAYKKMGQGFLQAHGGLAFAFKENMAVNLNINFMYMLPSSGVVIEPSLGFMMGL